MNDHLFTGVARFIDESQRRIEYTYHRKREDIIILLPPHYSFLVREYILWLRGREFADSPIATNGHLWSGSPMFFISPTNDCYVFDREYSLHQSPKEIIHFTMKLP